MNANTIFLRLEGALQAWGDQQSKFVIRRTSEAPTKSGVIGLVCAAMGVSRDEAPQSILPELNALHFGVRIDRPGIRWWDYHTVGAGMQMRTAEGKSKPGALLSRREYLCDASFLVALQGDCALIERIRQAFINPKWTVYLGRKSCPPSRPVLIRPDVEDDWSNPAWAEDLLTALSMIPWQSRLRGENGEPSALDCLADWVPEASNEVAPRDAEIWYDVPITFDPPSHHPRFVERFSLTVGQDGDVRVAGRPAQRYAPAPSRPRADYSNTEYKRRRESRLQQDHHLCVFCKSSATTVQHVTYQRAGGGEQPEDLRSLCRLCHDAVTMLEYGHGMGLERINPEDPQWRDEILKKRQEIIDFRSREKRRRYLSSTEEE